MKIAQKTLRDLLLAFVLISVGFALGKHYEGAKIERRQPDSGSKENVIRVYYMHSTFRCSTCDTIERMTKDLLDSMFKTELETGKIVFIDENFQKNKALAEKFDVTASCVVVAEVEEGKITNFERLDEVWTLMKDPVRFNQYISDSVRNFLAKLKT